MYKELTMRELLEKVERNEVILPAMQRDFVWKEERICRLFDSFVRGYPIGTFLMWNVEGMRYQNYSFSKIIKHYRERPAGNMQRGEAIELDSNCNYLVVLDGQQRITSLYMGILGTYTTHIKNRRWNDATAYECKALCYDVLSSTDEEGCGSLFMFKL